MIARCCLRLGALLLVATFEAGAPSPNVTSYNVLMLMVEKSLTNRFDLVHIGPAIDIAQKVIFTIVNLLQSRLVSYNYS